MPLLSPEKFT